MIHFNYRRNLIIVTAIMFCVSFLGCNFSSNYSGDGFLVDNGILAATDRYVLKLGFISLTEKKSYTYEMSGLPEKEFVAGVAIYYPPELLKRIEEKDISATLQFKLVDSEGRSIFHINSPLSSWTWNIPRLGKYAFLYVRDGASTYFTPSSHATYQLRVSVLEPESVANNIAFEIMASTAGWK